MWTAPNFTRFEGNDRRIVTIETKFDPIADRILPTNHPNAASDHENAARDGPNRRMNDPGLGLSYSDLRTNYSKRRSNYSKRRSGHSKRVTELRAHENGPYERRE